MSPMPLGSPMVLSRNPRSSEVPTFSTSSKDLTPSASETSWAYSSWSQYSIPEVLWACSKNSS